MKTNAETHLQGRRFVKFSNPLKLQKNVIEGLTLAQLDRPDLDGDTLLAGSLDDWLEAVTQIAALIAHDAQQCIGAFCDFAIAEGLLTATARILDPEAMEEQIERGDYGGISIGFMAMPADTQRKRQGYEFRKVKITEASFVKRPAHQAARFVKSCEDQTDSDLLNMERLKTFFEGIRI